MTALSRLLLRLRKRALRCYELSMLALLVSVAVAATLPATASGDGATARPASSCATR